MEEENKAVGINATIYDSRTNQTAEEREETSSRNKLRILLYVAGGIGALCILLWLLIGRIEAYVFDADNDALQVQLNEQKEQNNRLLQRIQILEQRVKDSHFQIEGLENKNAQLYVMIKDRDQKIEELQGIIAQQEVVNEALRSTIQKQQGTIEEQKHQLMDQAQYIDKLKDNIDQLYSDMRLVVGITNQELNRNQALEKQFQAVSADLTQATERIGQLTWKLMNVTEVLHETQLNKTLNWVGLTLMERLLKQRFVVKREYQATPRSCDSVDFYNQFKETMPNLFLATEESTGLVFGGYTEVNWTQALSEDMYKKDPMAFTFSGTLQEKCALLTPNEAIFTGRRENTRGLMLTYGKQEITIFDGCLGKGIRHRILPLLIV